MSDEPKQVIVCRKDLKMNAGKMAAQVAHASMAVILDTLKWVPGSLNEKESILHSKQLVSEDSAFHKWVTGRFTKIVVWCDDETQLLETYKLAQRAELPCSLIKDAGLTVFNEPTHTCVAIGPAYPEDIDKITGNFKLAR